MHKRRYEYHRNICPYCSDEAATELEHWESLARRLRSLVFEKEKSDAGTPVTPGQLRRIRREEAAWRNGFYYNPPLVLVLERTGTFSDEVKVAQTYHDLSLAGPGDLALNEGRAGGCELFVETWNTYILKSDVLGPASGEVSPGTVEAVLKMEDNPDYLPEWAKSPAPVTSDDPRVYFRRLEAETGSAFSVRSAARPMEDLKQNGSTASAGEALDETRKEMKKIHPGIRWTFAPETLDQMFAFCRFPDEYYPKAASDDDSVRLWANVAVLRKGSVETFCPVEVREPATATVESGNAVFGKITGFPRSLHRPRLVCFLQVYGKAPVVPAQLQFVPSNGHFYAVFERDRIRFDRLALAVIGEAVEEK